MTQRKLLLMVLMGVMASTGMEANARGGRRAGRAGKNTREPLDFAIVNPVNQVPTPQESVPNNAFAQDKPTLGEDKLAAKFTVSTNVKTGLDLKEDKVDGYTFLSAALGTTADKLNEVKGKGSKLKALAAMGENDKRLSEILPGQVAYDIIKAAAEGSDLKPKMSASGVSKGSTGIAFNKALSGDDIVFGTAKYALVKTGHSGTNNITDVPADLQEEYEKFVKALDDVVLVNAKGEEIKFNVESKADFASELFVTAADPKTTGGMVAVIRSAYKTAVDSFVDQLKSKTAKEKLFLPVVTEKDDKNKPLATAPASAVKGFAPGSSVDGIKATDDNSGFALRLIDIKKGAKKNILDTISGMMGYDESTNPPTAGGDAANPKLSAFITESGMKAFKKGAELYYSQEVDKKSEFSLEKLLNDMSADVRKEVNTTGLQKARAENNKEKIAAEKEKIANTMEAIVKRSMSRQGLSRFANAVPKDTEDMVG